ncbi:uncharacterized protein [Dermacentor andersoni]|nr:uncharacterized protein LOC129380993 isoform X2 [Dermacentor andersoni]
MTLGMRYLITKTGKISVLDQKVAAINEKSAQRGGAMTIGNTFKAVANGHLSFTDAKLKEAKERLHNKGVSVSRIDSRNATLQIVDENVASAAMAKEETIGHKEKPVETELASHKIRVDMDHKKTRQDDGTEKEETLITATYRGLTEELPRKLVKYFVEGL